MSSLGERKEEIRKATHVFIVSHEPDFVFHILTHFFRKGLCRMVLVHREYNLRHKLFFRTIHFLANVNNSIIFGMLPFMMKISFIFHVMPKHQLNIGIWENLGGALQMT